MSEYDKDQLGALRAELLDHPLYTQVASLADLRRFGNRELVPPVDMSSILKPARPLANLARPVLSETEISARAGRRRSVGIWSFQAVPQRRFATPWFRRKRGES